jgi:hypothetical protein
MIDAIILKNETSPFACSYQVLVEHTLDFANSGYGQNLVVFVEGNDTAVSRGDGRV